MPHDKKKSVIILSISDYKLVTVFLLLIRIKRGKLLYFQALIGQGDRDQTILAIFLTTVSELEKKKDFFKFHSNAHNS